MDKREFMGSLEKHLRYLPKDDKKDALEYYSEYIEDIGFQGNEDICSKLGDPKDIAKNIIAECSQKHIDERNEKKSAKNGAAVVWMTILMIFSLPVTLPLALTILILFFSVLLVAACAVFSIAITGLALFLSGLLFSLMAFFAPTFAQKAVIFGIALISIAIGILLIVLSILLTELTVKLIVLICKKMIRSRRKDNE